MRSIDRSLIIAMLALILSKISDGFAAGLWAVVSILWLTASIGEWVLDRKAQQ